MFKKGYGAETAEGAISYFKEKKIIDDLNFARLWIQSRMNQNPKGAIVLKRELKNKGVSPAATETALAEMEIKEKEGETLKKLVTVKAQKLKGLPKPEARKKLFGYLARRGFDFEAIEEVVREVIG